IELGQVVVLVQTPGNGGTLAMDLPYGHLYKQAYRFSGAGADGFSVLDDDAAALWTEFQRLGGVDELGYPVSQRFLFRGLITQAFQRAALQWSPDPGAAVRLNLLDELSQHGSDAWLLG